MTYYCDYSYRRSDLIDTVTAGAGELYKINIKNCCTAVTSMLVSRTVSMRLMAAALWWHWWAVMYW